MRVVWSEGQADGWRGVLKTKVGVRKLQLEIGGDQSTRNRYYSHVLTLEAKQLLRGMRH